MPAGVEEPEEGDDLGDLDGILDGGFEGLAQAVRKLGDAAEQIQSSGLNQRAVALILADASGLGLDGVAKVLAALGTLKGRYLTDE
jgi:hypothetical protein